MTGNDILDDPNHPLRPVVEQMAQRTLAAQSVPGTVAPPAQPAIAAPQSTPNGTGPIPAPTAPVSRETPILSKPAAPSVSPVQQRLSDALGSQAGIDKLPLPARIPLKILEGIGNTFLPAFTANLPGTALHHQLQIRHLESAADQEARRGTEQAQAQHSTAETAELGPNAASKRGLEASQTEEANARAESLRHPPDPKEWTQQSEPGIDPAHPELGAQGVWVNKNDPSQIRYTGKVAAKPADLKEEEKPLGEDRVTQLNELLTKRNPDYKLPANATGKDFERVQKLMEADLKDAETREQHASTESDRTAARTQQLELHRLNVAVANANREGTRQFQENERGRGLLDKAEGQYRTAAQSADELSSFIQSARQGNKVTAQGVPLETALSTVAAQGIKRINRTEVEQFGGSGDAYDKIKAFWGKWTAGQPVPPDILDDTEKLAGILKKSAYGTYREAHKSATKRYGLPNEEPLPDPNVPAATAAPMEITLPSGKKITIK